MTAGNGIPVVSRNISSAAISCTGLRVAKCPATARSKRQLPLRRRHWRGRRCQTGLPPSARTPAQIEPGPARLHAPNRAFQGFVIKANHEQANAPANLQPPHLLPGLLITTPCQFLILSKALEFWRSHSQVQWINHPCYRYRLPARGHRRHLVGPHQLGAPVSKPITNVMPFCPSLLITVWVTDYSPVMASKNQGSSPTRRPS